MKCPTCGENTPDDWKGLVVRPQWSVSSETEYDIEGPDQRRLHFDWMQCANDQCGQVVVRAHETRPTGFLVDSTPEETTDTWMVHPRHGTRPLDPLIAEREPDLARDYAEAVAILDTSHRMSAVLSRRILADLLEKYAGQDAYGLTDRINAFIADNSHPYPLRQNLHYLREIADFSAHTQTNDQLERLDASQEEAEWTLSIVERLFDYFIVAPEKDRKLREGMDAKLEAADRKPIQPLSPDSELPSAPHGEASS
jgi:hypothetical protein